MPVVNFSVPLRADFDGCDRAYKTHIADKAWEAAMAGPKREHSRWPANGEEIHVTITIHCEDMPYAKAEKETEVIVRATEMTLWNPKHPPTKITHVQIPWSKEKPRADVKVIQW